MRSAKGSHLYNMKIYLFLLYNYLQFMTCVNTVSCIYVDSSHYVLQGTRTCKIKFNNLKHLALYIKIVQESFIYNLEMSHASYKKWLLLKRRLRKQQI